ncbi:hypothetical protein AcV7_001982 [Taiwanofungus camphoratus]|nr:hypothetical protein AcV7_001982 [Antrodia cinnamomea]
MILPDDTPDSPAKSQQANAEATLNDAGSPESGPPPPAYNSYQQGLQIYPSVIPGDSAYVAPADVEVRIEPAPRRFFKALAIAVLIWLLFGMFARSAIELASWKSRRGRIVDGEFGWPRESDGTIVRCVNGHTDWQRDGALPKTSFELPLSADVLYLFSRGALSKGHISFIEDADWTQTDTVKVDVAIEYASRETLAVASACLLERKEGHKGIGLLTPERWLDAPFDLFEFDVTVRLPVSPDLSVLQIAAFETHLPSFEHSIGDLHNEITFRSLSLTSANSKIRVQSVDVDAATIKTTNGRIEGSFHASKSLSLITSNGPIRANVSLYHDNATDANVDLTMKTSNGPIVSNVDLVSTAPSSTGGAFAVSAKTSNSYLGIDFPEAALEAHLTVDARTTNAPATVSLNRAYEGAFDLRSSNVDPVLEFNGYAEDPSGQGRKRAMFLERSDRYIAGYVAWGSAVKRDGASSVSVKSTNSPAALDLL